MFHRASRRRECKTPGGKLLVVVHLDAAGKFQSVTAGADLVAATVEELGRAAGFLSRFVPGQTWDACYDRVLLLRGGC